MSLSKPKHVVERIASATERSPIAVFRCNYTDTLDAVFAATIHGQKRIRIDKDDLVGVFTNHDLIHSRDLVRTNLVSEANKKAVCNSGYSAYNAY